MRKIIYVINPVDGENDIFEATDLIDSLVTISKGKDGNVLLNGIPTLEDDMFRIHDRTFDGTNINIWVPGERCKGYDAIFEFYNDDHSGLYMSEAFKKVGYNRYKLDYRFHNR